MNKTKAVHVNGSPRKKWNTAKVLESAQEAGAECEMVNLYDIDFKGLQNVCELGRRLVKKAEG